MPQLGWGASLVSIATTKSTSSERARAAEKYGDKKTMYLPTGEQYQGSWSHNQRDGKGTVTLPNGDKYEGDWQDGKRCGMGTLWLLEDGRYRVRYNGEWRNNKPHGQGTMFFDDGDLYEGEWLNGMRHGQGQQVYGGRPGDHFGGDVYDGEWEADNRSGQGTMRYGNGDMYQGSWCLDMKHGDGVFFYLSKGKKYEGVWQSDIPKCGTYSEHKTKAASKAADVQLPVLCLQDPQQVVDEAVAALDTVTYY